MKTFACPYCKQSFPRNKLIDHIIKKHEDEIPEDLTPAQVGFDVLNNHPDHHGQCVVCHGPTKWCNKTQKYFRVCSDKCKKKLREQYKKNMIRVYGKTHLLDDPEQQEKMLAHRRISGTYVWKKDGTKFTYTGSYEKKLLEFLEDVMDFDSRDIMMPGPVLEYEYKGKKLHWITDCMILSLNLIIEIKDGGSHKNGRPMKSYREKQIYKEKMITNMGTYSYLRLTDNNFAQLLSILAEMKLQLVDTGSKDPMYRIHESEENYLKSVGDIAIQELNNTYLPVKMTTTGSMIDESSYEICTLKPINVSQSGRLLFSKSLYEAMDIVHDMFPGIGVECEYIDENNITEGMRIMVVDKTIGDIDVMG